MLLSLLHFSPLSVHPAIRPSLVSPETGDRSRSVRGHVGDSLSHPETLEGKHACLYDTAAHPGRERNTCGNAV